MTVLNPGSGPVPSATRDQAEQNIAVFTADLAERGLPVASTSAVPAADYGNGRFAFAITFTDGRTVEVQMPGIPTERLRYLDEQNQNIWQFPRLYVNGQSWVWSFALRSCGPAEDDD